MCSNYNMNNRKEKYRWHDGQGRQLTAGGLLPYDDDGIWTVSELKNGELVETDLGGKYHFDDCDIFQTIAREVSEELYFSSELRRKDVLQISYEIEPVYINGHKNHPVYICFLAHVDLLDRFDFKLDVIEFQNQRAKTLYSNPQVPKSYYTSLRLRHIPFSDLKDALQDKNSIRISYRLRRILQFSQFKHLFTD